MLNFIDREFISFQKSESKDVYQLRITKDLKYELIFQKNKSERDQIFPITFSKVLKRNFTYCCPEFGFRESNGNLKYDVNKLQTDHSMSDRIRGVFLGMKKLNTYLSDNKFDLVLVCQIADRDESFYDYFINSLKKNSFNFIGRKTINIDGVASKVKCFSNHEDKILMKELAMELGFEVEQ